jgi:hypothetical protein
LGEGGELVRPSAANGPERSEGAQGKLREPGEGISAQVAAKYNDHSVVEEEREILRALCRGVVHSRATLDSLRSYRWRESQHQVIFDFLMSVPGVSAELIREQLPSHLTRRGFPDFDLSWLKPSTQAQEDVERLIQRLTVSASFD